MQSIKPNATPIAEFSLREITEILIKHKNIHEGLYNLSLSFQIAVGAVGPSKDSLNPGAMIGVSRIGLAKTEKANNQTIDASEVNPLPKQATKTNK